MLRSLAAAGAFAVSGMAAQAASVTPDILFGTEFSNHGFTVESVDGLELGLRARLQYGANGADDEIGTGIQQDLFGQYSVTGTDSTAPEGEAFWAIDVAINSDTVNGTRPLSAYTYTLDVDYDPGNTTNMVSANVAVPGIAFYGDNSSVNGSVTADSGDPDLFNVAQKTFNYGYFTDAPLSNGIYQITLTAGGRFVSSVSTTITVIVENTPIVVDPNAPTMSAVPLPAGLPMLLTGLGAFMVMRRLKAA